MLKGNEIQLRALEPEDLNFLYQIENEVDIWQYGNTQTPFSKFVLKQYIENAGQDIFEAKQLRLVIETFKNETIGLVDLYDFDPKNRRAGIGILIAAQENKKKGFATEAMGLLINYGFKMLDLNQIYAHVGTDNSESRKLFEKLGFINAGIIKQWTYHQGIFKDELFYQLLKK